jgi:hypothetical protein
MASLFRSRRGNTTFRRAAPLEAQRCGKFPIASGWRDVLATGKN